jgi:hypothetical protein
MTDRDLKTLERRTFRAVIDDGLWDVVIATFFAMFAIAPLLSETMGDFWSVLVFLPIWLAAYLVVRVIRRTIVEPRIGTVRFGTERREQLRRLSLGLLVVNAVAAILGALAYIGVEMDWLSLGDGSIGYPLGLGIVVLVGFSGAALVTGIPRYHAYGLMLAVAPLVGEWLWRNDLASHHGYPIVFGIAAAIVFIGGMVRFVTLVRSHRPQQNHATV